MMIDKKKISYADNAATERADKAIDMAIIKFRNQIHVGSCTIGIDKDTNDVLVFIPTDAFFKANKTHAEKYFQYLRDAWKKLGFTILKEDNLRKGDVMNFDSYFFRLKSNT